MLVNLDDKVNAIIGILTSGSSLEDMREMVRDEILEIARIRGKTVRVPRKKRVYECPLCARTFKERRPTVKKPKEEVFHNGELIGWYEEGGAG